MVLKIRKKQFPYKLYRSTVVLIYHPEKTIEDLFTYAMKFDKEVINDFNWDWNDVAAMYYSTPSRKIYVFMGAGSHLSELAHECIHVVSSLFKNIDTNHTSDTEENFAYTYTLVFEELYKYIMKYISEDKTESFLMLSQKT